MDMISLVRFAALAGALFLLTQCAARQSNDASCVFDYERGEVGNCLKSDKAGTLFIAPPYRNSLPYDEYGLAPVWSRGRGWMYVGREGKVLISGVPNFDNGPDYFEDGLVRFVRGGKYGYADREGNVIVLPVYDGAMPFENGLGKVCMHCVDACAEVKASPQNCEHHALRGGDWYILNVHGQTVR